MVSLFRAYTAGQSRITAGHTPGRYEVRLSAELMGAMTGERLVVWVATTHHACRAALLEADGALLGGEHPPVVGVYDHQLALFEPRRRLLGVGDGGDAELAADDHDVLKRAAHLQDHPGQRRRKRPPQRTGCAG